MPRDLKVIDKAFQPLYGQPCWGVHYQRQLNLSMNFGKPSLSIREPFATKSKSETARRMAARRNVTVRGQYWLWIEYSYWRLASDGLLLATRSSSFRRIELAMIQLDGQSLTSVDVHPVTGATRFSFDLGGTLDCRRIERNTDDELWTLYKPRHLLSVYANGTYSQDPYTEGQPSPGDAISK